MRLLHTGISVRNLERSLEFYQGLLGMKLVALESFAGRDYETILGLKPARGRVAVVAAGTHQLELFEFAEPLPAPRSDNWRVCDYGLSHIAMQVESIEREYERLRAAGVHFFSSPVDFEGIAKGVYGQDPDGNVFELIEILVPPRGPLPS